MWCGIFFFASRGFVVVAVFWPVERMLVPWM
jgi:hypothetical protein